MKYTRPEGQDSAHLPFHDKIAENPREDTPSLVYADWLEENDQPHLAAFVREVVRTKNDYTNRDRVARVMHYAHRPAPDRAAPAVNSVYNYMGLGAHRESGRGRKKPPTTTEVSVQSPYSGDRHGYLSFSLDVPDAEAAEWTKRLISEGHPPANHARSSSLRRAVDAHAREVAAANAPPPPDAVDHNATKLSRLPRRVVRYSAGQGDLTNLMKRVRQDPYDVNLHGAVADALDETHPGNMVSELIRRQFGHGQYGGQGERSNDWYEPVNNAWDGTFYGHARLGAHGPFNLYLGHEGGPEQTQKWVVHAVSRLPGSRDTGYSFEFPHEEAHLIPQMFPAASAHINANELRGDMTHGGRHNYRNAEARDFDTRMEAEG